MPKRPKQFCNNGCKEYATYGTRYCNKCQGIKEEEEKASQKHYTEHEGSASAQGYDWKWTKVSRLVRRQEPVCRRCKNQLATMVDHIIPLKQGGARLNLENLQPLCTGCHAIKTAEDAARYTVR